MGQQQFRSDTKYKASAI